MNQNATTAPEERKLGGMSVPFLDSCLLGASVLLGLVHSWMSRYAMNPDGMSYLDLGDSFFQRNWAHAINAWWSPLYPWVVGNVLGILKPSMKWEFPVVHAVNFAIFLLALLAFRYLLYTFLAYSRAASSQESAIRIKNALPDWALVLLGYSIFWWIALEVQSLYSVGPDLLVVACFCLVVAMLMRLRPGAKLVQFANIGAVLGISYWAKTVMFPLGLVVLAGAYLSRRSTQGWARGIALATLIFWCICAPLIFMLSVQKGRFTFGDSGRGNYAWFVSPRTSPRNWQGEEPGSGRPVHPTRQLLKSPPVFEFDGPVVGTYPPWTDPTYWNEGLTPHFELKPQLEVLKSTVPGEANLLLRKRPELVLCVLILGLLSGSLWLVALRELWVFIALPAVGMAFYLPLVVNARYLGGFVLVLFLVSLSAVRFRTEDERVVRIVVVATFLMMALATAQYTMRVMNHSIPVGEGPSSTEEDLQVAERLRELGITPGTKVAVIGDGSGAYWARLAHLRIVAEIMDRNRGSVQFWRSPESMQRHVYELFQCAHARLAVASCASSHPYQLKGWKELPGTSYCVYNLDTQGFSSNNLP